MQEIFIPVTNKLAKNSFCANPLVPIFTQFFNGFF